MFRNGGLGWLIATIAAAGCGGAGDGGASGSPQLDMRDFSYDDLSCQDDVPFSFTVSNSGDGDATDVTVQVGVAGQASFSANIGTVTIGQDVQVNGDFPASDSCLFTDPYTVNISLSPSNGDEADFTAAIAI